MNETSKIIQRFIEQNLTRAYKKQRKSISQKLVQKKLWNAEPDIMPLLKKLSPEVESVRSFRIEKMNS